MSVAPCCSSTTSGRHYFSAERSGVHRISLSAQITRGDCTRSTKQLWIFTNRYWSVIYFTCRSNIWKRIYNLSVVESEKGCVSVFYEKIVLFCILKVISTRSTVETHACDNLCMNQRCERNSSLRKIPCRKSSSYFPIVLWKSRSEFFKTNIKFLSAYIYNLVEKYCLLWKT